MKLTDEEWKALAEEQKKTLDFWWDKGILSGHEDITIEIRRKKGYIEIRPCPSIRTREEQAIYEKD